jgi:hypothetical protein
MKNVLASMERAAVLALGGLGASGREPAAGDLDGLRRCIPETAAPADGCLPSSAAPDDGCFPARPPRRS